MIPLDIQLRLIRFLSSNNQRAEFIAQHVQQRGYGDPTGAPVEVGLRERVAYIVMMGTESNGPARAWSIDTDAQKDRVEAIEAELLAEAFQALSVPAWKTLIDACAQGPETARALALRWKGALDQVPDQFFSAETAGVAGGGS